MSMCEMAMVIGLGCGRRTVDLRTVRNSMWVVLSDVRFHHRSMWHPQCLAAFVVLLCLFMFFSNWFSLRWFLWTCEAHRISDFFVFHFCMFLSCAELLCDTWCNCMDLARSTWAQVWLLAQLEMVKRASTCPSLVSARQPLMMVSYHPSSDKQMHDAISDAHAISSRTHAGCHALGRAVNGLDFWRQGPFRFSCCCTSLGLRWTSVRCCRHTRWWRAGNFW